MTEVITLYGGPIFDGERMRPDGAVVFNREGILEIKSAGEPLPPGRQIDVQGQLITPGLVDLHCDAIEKCIEIRPKVFFDPDFAISHLDQRLASCGITTFYHAISFSDYEIGLSSKKDAVDLVFRIKKFAQSVKASVRHRVHARCELNSPNSMALIRDLIQQGQVDLLSIMDHTPGQGQFQTLESYVAYCTQVYGTSAAEILASLEEKRTGRARFQEALAALTTHATAHRLPIVSHDDDTPEKVALVHDLGAGGCEFPITLDAAREATGRGMSVFMGAPNLMRGASTNGNLEASTAIAEGLCTGLVSDYVPESLIHAPFVTHTRMGLNLAESFRLVTRHPARYLDEEGIDGRLVPGSAADLIVIDTAPPWCRVRQTWVGGQRRYLCS
jgi:alpha-D-ribose 1-methylphosphonate 5-triphosphate diphosphatase